MTLWSPGNTRLLNGSQTNAGCGTRKQDRLQVQFVRVVVQLAFLETPTCTYCCLISRVPKIYSVKRSMCMTLRVWGKAFMIVSYLILCTCSSIKSPYTWAVKCMFMYIFIYTLVNIYAPSYMFVIKFLYTHIVGRWQVDGFWMVRSRGCITSRATRAFNISDILTLSVFLSDCALSLSLSL